MSNTWTRKQLKPQLAVRFEPTRGQMQTTPSMVFESVGSRAGTLSDLYMFIEGFVLGHVSLWQGFLCGLSRWSFIFASRS